MGAAHGNVYSPLDFGNKGGNGGGANPDAECGVVAEQIGGLGGGIIELTATMVEIDGEVFSNGESPAGARGGGGSGGSILIKADHFLGLGDILAKGGSVPQTDGACHGGGGGGGRVSVQYTQNTYTGTLTLTGGSSPEECGGAGTLSFKDLNTGHFSLVVDNQYICTPLKSTIDFGNLDDQHRGLDSCRTYLFDVGDEHDHEFADVSVSGGAMLALYRQNTDTFLQTLTINQTSGDKSTIVHAGPDQVSPNLSIFRDINILKLRRDQEE